MKGVLPWLICWACRAGTRDFGPALAALVGPLQNIIFPRRTLIQFINPHRPASWAGCRAGSPVSYSMCLWKGPSLIHSVGPYLPPFQSLVYAPPPGSAPLRGGR
jgi:hypothetical protein